MFRIGDKIMHKLLIILLIFFCFGCERAEKTKFKTEFEKYNDKYLAVDLEGTSLIEYTSIDEVNRLIQKGTGVVYFGSPKDNLSRKAIDILLEAALKTNLDKIYYLDTVEGIKGLDGVNGKEIPMVLFLLDGKMIKCQIGTIANKVEMTDEERGQLYNIYLDGIHQVLKDGM